MSEDKLVDFKQLEKLGEGSFGTVFKVQHKKTGGIYVLKKISTKGMSKEDLQDAEQEFEIHKTIKNDYIVKYESHFEDKGFICILLEYMDNGDVGQYLKKNCKDKLLAENQIWKIFIQTCLGVQYLHTRKILHRDLKTINLFLNQDMTLKIGDLGVAKEMSETHTDTVVGTPYYLSPELCEERPYNNKSDIWSLGVILYELCTCRHPFDARTQGGLFLKIIKGNYEPIPKLYTKELAEIIDHCLQKNCKDRPTIQQILENQKVVDEAANLQIYIPTDEEIKQQVEEQRTDFLTTYKKSNGTGLKNTLTKKTLRSTRKFNHVSKVCKGKGSKNSSKNKKSTKRRKKTTDSIDDVTTVADSILKIPGIGSPSKGVLGNLKAKPKETKKANYLRPTYSQMQNTKAKVNKAGKRNSENTKGTNITPSANKRPTSSKNPARNYNKPWNENRAGASKNSQKSPHNSKKEIEDRQSQREKAEKLFENRKQAFRPIIQKPQAKELEVKKDYSQNNKEESKAVENGQEMPQVDPRDEHNVPEEEQKEHEKVSKQASYEQNQIDLSVPLSQIDENHYPKITKEKESEESKKPQKVNKTSLLISQAKQGRGGKCSKNSNSSKDLPEQEHDKPQNDFDKTEKIHEEFDVVNTFKGDLEETKDYPEDDSDDSSFGQFDSGEGEYDSYYEEYDDEEYNPFDANDVHFDDEENYIMSPFGSSALDEIKEEQEISMSCQEEDAKNTVGASRTNLPSTMAQSTLAEPSQSVSSFQHPKLSEKWSEMVKMVPDESKLLKCYEYYSNIMKTEKDFSDKDKMREVHVFAKQLEVPAYRDVIFECFQLKSLENSFKK
ncbi:unnamed protein product [Moneuplotes crassus]|uniref:non-specific serine/threonine protein kinase n=1 Tax=Euplotes crassus TaxID=5936 RepID=A0AAD2DAC7_EUPCR|nr:unnamed protein product [Moneuplotes crassus]